MKRDKIQDLQTAKEIKQGMREICQAFPFVPPHEVKNIVRRVRQFERVVTIHISIIINNGDYNIAIELLKGLNEMIQLVEGSREWDELSPQEVENNIRSLYNI